MARTPEQRLVSSLRETRQAISNSVASELPLIRIEQAWYDDITSVGRLHDINTLSALVEASFMMTPPERRRNYPLIDNMVKVGYDLSFSISNSITITREERWHYGDQYKDKLRAVAWSIPLEDGMLMILTQSVVAARGTYDARIEGYGDQERSATRAEVVSLVNSLASHLSTGINVSRPTEASSPQMGRIRARRWLLLDIFS